MRLALSTFAALQLAAAAVAQAPPPAVPPAETPAPVPPPVTEETKKLQGFWKCRSIVYDGAEQMSDAAMRDALTLKVVGSEYRMYLATDAGKDEHVRLFTAHIAFDSAAKTFTNTVVDGREKGKKVHGIYDLAGGTFRTCYGPADKPRPTKFEAGKGSGLFLETWTVEPTKPGAAGQPAGGK